jgi:predicted AlkP superfamily pyrophosphatase or phosphodiesterase
MALAPDWFARFREEYVNKLNLKHSYTSPVDHAQRLHVFVLIDALGWEIIKDRPFLNDELPFRKPLDTVLGYSSGAIPTILTGLHPAQTGHWNLYYYDPVGSPFRWLRWLSFLPEWVLDNRIGRRAVKELGRRVLGMGPLFECAVSPALLPYFNFVEKRNIYAEGGIPNSVSIFDLMKARGIPYRVYSYHQMSDSRIVEQAQADIQLGGSQFFFIYLSEMDHFLHGRCGEHEAVAERLAWYDQQLREVFKVAARRDPQMKFTVISDHGMTRVHSQYDLVNKIEALGFSMPQQYLAVYDSTMARYWFFDDDARKAIVEELRRTSCGRILEDSELEHLGILFPDRRYGEVVFLLDPGWLLATSDFNGNGWHPVGMHGYHPSDSHSDAIFLSNQHPRHQMSTIADIYPCMAEVVQPDER